MRGRSGWQTLEKQRVDERRMERIERVRGSFNLHPDGILSRPLF